MLARVKSVATVGLESQEVVVEVDVAARGFPSFTIVGLPSKAVDEARERVKTAIVNSGASFPDKKITVNLAPADLPKEGSNYDLPIAMGILLASGEIEVEKDASSKIQGVGKSQKHKDTDLTNKTQIAKTQTTQLGDEVSGSGEESEKLLERSYFYGELGLDGALRHSKGVLLVGLEAKNKKIREIYVPILSAAEAAVVDEVKVYPVRNLKQLVDHIKGIKQIKLLTPIGIEDILDDIRVKVDFAEIVGQEQAKRAMEIAAAGGHNLLTVGPPGAGKTMLAKALPGILPPLSKEESLEVTRIYSVSGMVEAGEALVRRRPFRAPHHTISRAGLIGGGSIPMPGEISLSHLGVLFLDELPEFPRASLEVLRQPMEDGVVVISRAKARASYPASFMLVGSANPCPCGYLNHPSRACQCGERAVEKYRRRISGPILDRIDLHVWVDPVETDKLAEKDDSEGEGSEEIRARVMRARGKQEERFASDVGVYNNAQMSNKQVRKFCKLEREVEGMLQAALARFSLSARAYFKLIKVARTIADLGGVEEIGVEQMAEAVQYREKTF